jgi:uncharacterized protein (DUF2147 family)
MKFKKIFLVAIAMLFFVQVKAQRAPADAILGQWWDEEKIVKVEIYQKGNEYFGKLIWGKTMFDKNGASNKDVKNPDDKQKKRDLLNLIMLTNFVYKDGEWTGGKIYDASRGKTYSSIMKLEKEKLIIRGYVGLSMFGRNTTWERVK